MSALLAEIKGADYLIKPFLERGTTTSLFGDSGAYKSFLMVDLLCCVATGKHYHDRNVIQGVVVLLVGEGHSGIARRVAVWKMMNKVQDDIPVLVSEVPAELMSDGANGIVSVAASIEIECMRQFSALPVAIGIDTLSANFGDGDVSSNADVAKAIRGINVHLRDRFDAAVLIVMHVGHGDKNRELGAYALRGNVDARILVRETATGCSMHSEKVKDGTPFNPVQFKTIHMFIPDLYDSEGEAQGSLALEEVDYTPSSESTPDFLSGQKKQLFDVINILQKTHGDEVTRQAVMGECLRTNIFKDSNGFGNRYREMVATGHIVEEGNFIRAKDV
jgi:hypothetical protein